MFDLEFDTCDAEGRPSAKRDRIQVVALDLDQAMTLGRSAIGKTYKELGWPERSDHYKVTAVRWTKDEASIEAHEDIWFADEILTGDIIDKIAEQVSKSVMRRLMNYIDSVGPREI